MINFDNMLFMLQKLSKKELISILILALFFFLSGYSQIFAPYDWLQQTVAANVNAKPYDGDAVFIAIDEPTLDELDGRYWTEADLARLLDRVAGASPKQVLIAPQFFESDKGNDKASLSRALTQLPVKPIWQLALNTSDARQLSKANHSVSPADFIRNSPNIDPLYRAHVTPSIMVLRAEPFGAPLYAPSYAITDQGMYPSSASLLADGRTASSNIFTIDSRYTPGSIRVISASTIIDKSYDARQLDGKRLVIGHSGNPGRDTFVSAQDSYTPRTIGTIMAAQTLIEGPPHNIGWLPAFLIALIAIFLWALLPRPYGRIVALLIFLILIFSPLILERYLVFARTSQGVFMMLCWGIAKIGQRINAAIETYRDAAESKSRFLAQASHDLRQPIHAVGLLADRLAQSDLTASQSELVSKISWSVDNAARMFRSLLDIAAIESGTLKTDIEAVAISELLAEIDNQYSLVAEQASVDLRLVPSELIVKTDRALAGTMLQNLVSNAIKYAPGKSVVVGCRRQGKTLSLYVVDNGRGISESDLKHVKNEFYRSSNKSVLGSDNKGLGLAIVGRLSKLLGLKFSLRSNFGRGTSAAITGLVVMPAKSIPTAARNLQKLPLAGLKVAITDDDKETLASTQRLLEQWGCMVQSYNSFPKGLNGYDVLLTDFDFGNGVTLANNVDAIKEIMQGGISIIIISGHHPDQIRDEIGIETGLILSKPLRAAQLRSALMASQVRG